MAFSSPRMCFDGRLRYVIVAEAGTIYLYRYVGFTGVSVPFQGGDTRKAVMAADAADIDFFHNFLVVDNVDVATMVSPDGGEHWFDRTDG